MSFLLPVATMILVLLGAFCLFISMDNRKKTFLKNPIPPKFSALSTKAYEAPESVYRE